VALIVSVIGTILNYMHTNNLFEQSNYPKLICKPQISGGINGTFVRLDVTNTHNTTSVSDMRVFIEVSARRRRISILPSRFIFESTMIEKVQPKSTAHTAVQNDGETALRDLNETIIAKIPDMFVRASDKVIRTKKIDGTPGKETPTN